MITKKRSRTGGGKKFLRRSASAMGKKELVWFHVDENNLKSSGQLKKVFLGKKCDLYPIVGKK